MDLGTFFLFAWLWTASAKLSCLVNFVQIKLTYRAPRRKVDVSVAGKRRLQLVPPQMLRRTREPLRTPCFPL